MQLRKGMIATGLAVAGALLAAGPAAQADTATQTVDGTVSSSVSISTAPTASVSFGTLASLGANTAAGGTLEVQSNVAYTLTVKGLKAKMTEYNSGTATYGTKVLTNAMSVVPTLSSGVGVPVTATVGTTDATLATSTGLTTDSYSLSLSQPTALTDVPASYRNELTYTAVAS